MCETNIGGGFFQSVGQATFLYEKAGPPNPICGFSVAFDTAVRARARDVVRGVVWKMGVKGLSVRTSEKIRKYAHVGFLLMEILFSY